MTVVNKINNDMQGNGGNYNEIKATPNIKMTYNILSLSRTRIITATSAF